MALLSLILILRTNFKYRFISLSEASSIFILRNLANVGGDSANDDTHFGYSDLSLTIGADDDEFLSLDGG